MFGTNNLRNKEGEHIKDVYPLLKEKIFIEIDMFFENSNNPIDMQRLALVTRRAVIKALIERGFTQTAIAEAMNSTRTTISKLLRYD